MVARKRNSGKMVADTWGVNGFIANVCPTCGGVSNSGGLCRVCQTRLRAAKEQKKAAEAQRKAAEAEKRYWEVKAEEERKTGIQRRRRMLCRSPKPHLSTVPYRPPELVNKICTKCGYPNNVRANRCAECGKQLSARGGLS